MNAEIYVLRDMDEHGEVSNQIKKVATALKKNNVTVAYKTELDHSKYKIMEGMGQSLQPGEQIELIVIPGGYKGEPKKSVVYSTLEKLSAQKSSKEKRTLEVSLGGFSHNFKELQPINNGKDGYFCVIDGASVLLLPAVSDDKIEQLITNALKAMSKIVPIDDDDNHNVSMQGVDIDREETLNNIIANMDVDGILVDNEDVGNADIVGYNPDSAYDEYGNAVKKSKPTFKERFIPMKGDSTKEKIRKIVLDLAIIVFIVTAIILVKVTVVDPFLNDKKYDEIRDLVSINTEIATEITTDAKGNVVIKKAKSSKNWKELEKINKEIIAWVSIDDTKIDYPVVQHKDDTLESQFYLHRDVYKNYSGYGSIFADFRSNKGVDSKNIILHGHHMNDGSMFQNLMGYGKYSADMDFYKKHPTIKLDTPKGDHIYKIISVFKTNTLDAHGEFFNYLTASFVSDAEFMNYVYLVRERSLIDTGVTCNEDDMLLTLSTCSYEYSEFRTVVVARKVRPGESAKVDTAKAKPNKNPLWPDVYYGYDNSAKPNVTTFKTVSKKKAPEWYDGAGNLKGKERMFTLHDGVTEEAPTEATEPTQPTEPGTQLCNAIKFKESVVTLDIDQSAKLELIWSPAETTDKNIKWSSSNANVVNLQAGGVVTALTSGVSKITAQTSNGKRATCTVKVNPITATALSLSPSEITLNKIGEKIQLTAEVKPDNATHSVVWESSNVNVATVSNSGMLLTKGYGTCKITATIDTLTVSCTVTVKKPQVTPQQPTQKPTQRPTQKPTEKPTQKPTQPPTQKPTQEVTQPVATEPIEPDVPVVPEEATQT